jgi:hypothetical protein
MKKMKEKVDGDLPKWAKNIIKFSFGKNKPVTKEEKELAKSIQDIKKKGRFIEIPND